MARYVKIKRSKNLRFKLISLMYLIFLVLSIVQIPSDWLKINRSINQYLNKTEGNFEDASLEEISIAFDKVFLDYSRFIRIENQIEKPTENNSFKLSDEYFLNGASGKELFKIFIQLKKWAQLLPENDESKKLYFELFNDDLSNGIEEEDSKKWINWRWKHLPLSLSVILMDEIKLRIKLLSQFEKKLGNNQHKNSFRIRNNQSKMKVGDKTELLLIGDSIEEVQISRNDISSEEFTIHGDTLIFTPASAGEYKLHIRGKSLDETFYIDVKPRSFGLSDQEVLKVVYCGVKYKEEIKGLTSEMKVQYDPECIVGLNFKESKIEYLTKKAGWHKFKISNNKGLFCFDSVYAKVLPEPIINLKDLATNTLSKKRFYKNGELELTAMHPSFGSGVFEIKKFRVKWVGAGSKSELIEGNKINVNADEIKKMQYLIIHSIEYKSGIEIIKREQPIIIQII